jgi:hypothetical protein
VARRHLVLVARPRGPPALVLAMALPARLRRCCQTLLDLLLLELL